MATRQLGFTVLLCTILAGFADAEAISYEVNLSEVHSSSGHLLRLAGTIDADTTTDEILGSNLAIYHDTDPGVPLTALPSSVIGSGVQWIATNDELRVTPINNGGVEFTTTNPDAAPIGYALNIGSTGDQVFVLFGCACHGLASEEMLITDDIANGGYLLGIAVPEPSSISLAIWLGIIGLVLRGRRRNR